MAATNTPLLPRRRARRPIVIGHRGASGYRPEHTLAAYWLAIEQGADFIEPDLVSTQDGVLVARHENEISTTTDVASRARFAVRRKSKVIDGRRTEGFFTEDFSLAELKTLRAKERLPELRPANVAYEAQYTIPTFDQVIALAKLGSALQGREIGVYPETKHPSYFESIGLPLEPPLVRTLHWHGYRGPRAAVFIQSFEVANLKRLRGMTQLPLVQLLDATSRPYDWQKTNDARSAADMVTAIGLCEIATYADAIGPNKNMILARGDDQQLMAATSLVEDAHVAGLQVHAWTFRRENSFLPAEFRRGDESQADYAALAGDLPAEVARFLELGLDGVFSDHPDVAVAARNRFEKRQR